MNNRQLVTSRLLIVPHKQVSPGQRRVIPGFTIQRIEASELMKRVRPRFGECHGATFGLHEDEIVDEQRLA